jgi:hypothetical protein
MRARRVFWGAAFVVFFLLWALANYPALIQAWWYRDDFTFGWIFAKHSLSDGIYFLFGDFESDGRPLAILDHSLFYLNQYPRTNINIALHWTQGLAHTGLALFIATTLARYLPRWQAALATLPFLLWCFNGEVALYSSAAHYLVSGYFSLAGLRFILAGIEHNNPRWCRIGVLLTALSLLTLQTASILGLMIWTIILALRLTSMQPLTKASLREGLWLVAGFVAGGIFTTGLAFLNASPRAQLAPDLWSQAAYWIELNRTFLFWPRFYSTGLCLFHSLALLLGLAITVFYFLSERRPGSLLLVLALFATGSVLPYLANLIVTLHSLSFRTFYFAPLIFTLVFAVSFSLTRRSTGSTGLITTLILATCFIYFPIAQENARDYVRLYQSELAVARILKKAGTQNDCRFVAVTSSNTSDNPFRLHYPWADSHECDFAFPYTLPPCMDLLSNFQLQPTKPDSAALSFDKAQSVPAPSGVQIDYLPDAHLFSLQVK